MSLVVSEECLRLGLRAGAIVFRHVRVAPADVALRSEITREAWTIQQRFAGSAAMRSTPEVAAFHDILRKVGVPPSRDRSSVDRLLSYAIKRSTLPTINSLVDAYNLISIRSCCSLGAHDLDRISLPVSLQVFASPQAFTPLGGGAEAAVNAGEYGYLDARGRVLCRLDVVQADFSKVTCGTVNALLIIEGTTTHTPAALRQTFDDAIELVQRSCGGTAEVVAFPPADVRSVLQ
jgi:DNA/RNA-binding domain of Phe-tRNA-synthetase-like protein